MEMKIINGSFEKDFPKTWTAGIPLFTEIIIFVFFFFNICSLRLREMAFSTFYMT